MSRKPIVFADSRASQKHSKAYNKRLRAILSVMTLLGLLVISLYFNSIRNAELRAIESRLETVTELRRAALTRFMGSHDQETRLWAGDSSIRNAAIDFFVVWETMNGQEREAVRAGYLITGKDRFQPYSAPTQAYADMHAKLSPVFKAFQIHHEYYDVFLFNPEGDLVYSNEKEDDFALNFSNRGGKYKDTGLAKVFRLALENTDMSSSYVDFTSYAPSNGDEASFIARPIWGSAGDVIGVYAIQIPMDNFNAKIQYASGLGETGETYLVGEDLMMRNDSRLAEGKTSLMLKVDTQSVRMALAGKDVVRKGINIRGQKTLVAAKPMDFNGTRWAVVTEMEMAEIWAPYRPYLWFYIIALICVFIFGIVQYFLLRVKTDIVELQ